MGRTVTLATFPWWNAIGVLLMLIGAVVLLWAPAARLFRPRGHADLLDSVRTEVADRMRGTEDALREVRRNILALDERLDERTQEWDRKLLDATADIDKGWRGKRNALGECLYAVKAAVQLPIITRRIRELNAKLDRQIAGEEPFHEPDWTRHNIEVGSLASMLFADDKSNEAVRAAQQGGELLSGDADFTRTGISEERIARFRAIQKNLGVLEGTLLSNLTERINREAFAAFQEGRA
jgi:hypothetical protein